MHGVVYKITNSKNGSFYIGQTITPFNNRWSKHCGDARNGAGWVFAAAIRKYGPEAFYHEILAMCNTQAELNATESRYITELQPRYNARGGGGQLGSPSQMVRDKISRAGKGRKPSMETRLKLSEANRRRVVSEATRAKHRARMAGVVIRKNTPMSASEKAQLAARNRARRTRPVDNTLQELYAAIGAVTKSEKMRVAALRHHANNPNALLGAKNPMFGRKLSEHHIQKLRILNTGVGNPFYGGSHTEATRAKMREAHAQRPPVTCPHCGKVGHLNPMKRWHFDNCRKHS